MTGEDGETPRKELILQGAFAALRDRGLPDISYDLIAEKAGVSRQLVRYHYPDSEALMLEVCDLLAQSYRDCLITTAGSLDGPARIDAFLDFYFDLLDGTPKPRDDRIYDAMFALSGRSEAIRGALAGQYRLLGQVLGHEFEVQNPGLDRQAAEELSYLFVCLMYGHWKMVASLGFSEDHREISRRAMNRLILSYAQNAGETEQTVAVWARAQS